MATEVADCISKHLDMPIKEFFFDTCTDSRVVLGYIHNQSRRFYTYVTNRVAKIRSSTHPRQWQYVSTDRNPADQPTRAMSAFEMHDSDWLTAYVSLLSSNVSREEEYEMVDPDEDCQI